MVREDSEAKEAAAAERVLVIEVAAPVPSLIFCDRGESNLAGRGAGLLLLIAAIDAILSRCVVQIRRTDEPFSGYKKIRWFPVQKLFAFVSDIHFV